MFYPTVFGCGKSSRRKEKINRFNIVVPGFQGLNNNDIKCINSRKCMWKSYGIIESGTKSESN